MNPQYSELLKRKVAELLLEMPRGSQRRIARALDVSERTLLNWKRSYTSPKKRGRRPKAVSLPEQLAIAREWKRQGYPGSRPVIEATGVRARVARETIAALKARRKKRAAQIRKRVQVRLKVQQPLAFAVMDGASLTKGDDYIIYRDRATLSIEAKACNDHLNASHTVALLDELKAQARLPMVIGTDNGSPFCAGIVQDYLRENKVIHLRSLPRVPQHNGSAENAVMEFKELLSYGMNPVEACKTLNQSRLRMTLNWKTSSELSNAANAVDPESRQAFYETARSRVNEAVLGTKSGYALRKAEREAILQTMEDFELITRTRGGLPLSAKAEANA